MDWTAAVSPSNSRKTSPLEFIDHTASNPDVSPRPILQRHPEDEVANVGVDTWAPRTSAFAPVVLPCYELSVPAQNGVRSDDGPQLPERPPANGLAFSAESAPVSVCESNPTVSELGSENSILRLEVLNRPLLLAVHPARQDEQ